MSMGDVHWKEYVDRIFLEHQRAIDAALVQVNAAQTIQQHAVEVALTQVEQRIQATQDLATEKVNSVRREALAALAASEKAITKSELANATRFEAVNEFRGQLNDQATTFMPREVADSQIGEIRRVGEQHYTDLRHYADSQIGEMRTQMTTVLQRLDQTAGASSGSTKTIAYMITAVGFLLTVVIFVANYFSSR